MLFSLPRGFRAFSRRRFAASLQPVRTAARSALERLESRQLMSGTPAFSYGGATSVNEGSNYNLTLAAANADSGTQSWSINWGDGQTQTYNLTGASNVVTHVFADGPLNPAPTITATVQYNSASYPASPAGTSGGPSQLSLDSQFGSSGVVTTHFPDGISYAHAVAVLPDHSIVAAGQTADAPGVKWAISKYLPNGSLDTNFAGGKIVQTFSSLAIASAVTFVPGGTTSDDRILVAGNVGSGIAIAKYDLHGNLDTTFGTGGILTTQIQGGADSETVVGMSILPDGTILVGGTTNASGYGDLYLADYDQFGNLVASFGSGGTVVTDLSSGLDDQAADFSVTLGGDIVMAGSGQDAGGNAVVELARYDRFGSLASSSLSSLTNVTTSMVTSVAIQSLGANGERIVVGVLGTGHNSYIARYAANLSPDNSFSGGRNYLAVKGFNNGDVNLTDVAVLSDQSLVLSGSQLDGTGQDEFVLAHYTSAGVLDGTPVLTHVGDYGDTPLQLAVGSSGEVVFAGQTTTGLGSSTDYDFALTRYVSAATPGPLVVTVNNVAPSVTVGAGVTGVRQQDLSISAGFSDPGAEGSWNVTVDYGDGTVDHLVKTTTGSLGLHHSYNAIGNYNVTVTMSDGDAGGVTTAAATVNVSLYTYVPDPTAAGRNLLLVGGTGGADSVTIDGQLFGRVGVTIGGTSYNLAAPTGAVVVYAGAGDDRVKTSGVSLYPVLVFGQDGNDRLDGGIIGSILVGGDGDDDIHGGGLRDLLIGGAGSDKLAGNTGDDILIGGVTSWDENATALLRIWQEWGDFGTSYAGRVAHLQGATGGLNAGYYLKSGTGATVFDDTGLDELSYDALTGGSGDDWYLANISGIGVRDKISGATRAEITTDIAAQ